MSANGAGDGAEEPIVLGKTQVPKVSRRELLVPNASLSGHAEILGGRGAVKRSPPKMRAIFRTHHSFAGGNSRANEVGLIRINGAIGPATVDAVIYFRVVDPNAAVVKVENFLKATSLIAQTTLRSVLGQSPLDDLLAQRDIINQKLQAIIDKQTEPWGIKVTAVEVKEVALPESMKRAMAKQAEAERERRAKVVNAEGEFQAAEKMVQAAAMIAKEPIALQLRYLQTMREISSEHNTTTFLPIPMDLFSSFLKK